MSGRKQKKNSINKHFIYARSLSHIDNNVRSLSFLSLIILNWYQSSPSENETETSLCNNWFVEKRQYFNVSVMGLSLLIELISINFWDVGRRCIRFTWKLRSILWWSFDSLISNLIKNESRDVTQRVIISLIVVQTFI